jgi:hypothetical protein
MNYLALMSSAGRIIVYLGVDVNDRSMGSNGAKLGCIGFFTAYH